MEPKSYMNLDHAKRAVKKAGLAQMDVRYDNVTGSYRGAKNFMPVILVDLPEDRREVEDRGFHAEMKCDKLMVGASVRLMPGTEIAKVLDITDDLAFLDRALGGTRYWTPAKLELIAKEDD